MNHFAENKREYERFDLKFPATVEISDGQSQKLQLHTRDISAGGAFLVTTEPFETGVKIKMEVIISNETLKKLTGYESCLKVGGTVVRSGPEGMAVSFSDRDVLPLRSMMDH